MIDNLHLNMEKLVSENLVNASLNLENKKLGDAGARILADMETLSQVTTLELGDNEIGDLLAYIRSLNAPPAGGKR